MATSTETRPWQAVIIDQLGVQTPVPEATHAVVYLPPVDAADEPDVLDTTVGEPAAMISAEDWATKVEGGEITIVKLDDLVAWNRDHSVEVTGLTIEPQRQNVETEPAEEVHEDGDQVVDGEPLEDDEAIEPQSIAAPPADPGGQTKAFDASDYDREDLQIAKIDGQSVDKIRVRLTGDIMLDRSEPADVALYNRLLLGQPCELRVAGKVGASAGGFTTNREGDLDAVVGSKTVKVDTVWVLEPEQL